MKAPIANFSQGKYGLEIRIKTDQGRSTEPKIRTHRYDLYTITLQQLARAK